MLILLVPAISTRPSSVAAENLSHATRNATTIAKRLSKDAGIERPPKHQQRGKKTKVIDRMIKGA